MRHKFVVLYFAQTHNAVVDVGEMDHSNEFHIIPRLRKLHKAKNKNAKKTLYCRNAKVKETSIVKAQKPMKAMKTKKPAKTTQMSKRVMKAKM